MSWKKEVLKRKKNHVEDFKKFEDIKEKDVTYSKMYAKNRKKQK